MSVRTCCLAVCLLAITIAPLRAQETVQKPCSPQPACTFRFITETGVAYSPAAHAHLQINFTLGMMQSVNAKNSIGGEFFLTHQRDTRGGIAVRGRRYLTSVTSVDVVAGVHVFGEYRDLNLVGGSPTLQLRINSRDERSIVLRTDFLKLTCPPSGCYGPEDKPGFRPIISVGGEVGGGTGLVMLGATAVIGAILIGSVVAAWSGN